MNSGKNQTEAVVLDPDSGFRVRQLEEESGIPISRCYQCLKCTNGCPVTPFMDLPPHQVIRCVQLGLFDRILHTNTMWVCSTCATCATRCPNDIDVTGFMDFLKNKIVALGVEPREKEVVAFHEAFLSEIKRGGRINELLLMAKFSMKRGGLLERIKNGEMVEEMRLGLEMFRKGRLNLSIRKAPGADRVKKLFKERRK